MMSQGQPIKILAVDDTATYRRILSEVEQSVEGAELLGTAPNGRIAIKKIEYSQPDFVLLDLEMPEMDGLETMQAIRKRWPEIRVVVISGYNSASADKTIKALEAGAIDFIAKPEGNDLDSNMEFLRNRVQSLLRLHSTQRFTSQIKQSTLRMAVRPETVAATVLPPAPVRAIATKPDYLNLLAIGSSTGGPEALAKLIPELPGNLGVPVLLVQHMPPVFTASLARNLDKRSALTVKEAEEGEDVLPNVVYIAPGGSHMVVRGAGSGLNPKLTIGINQNPPVKSCRPSVDVLFRSIAANFGRNVLAVVLTGMGEPA